MYLSTIIIKNSCVAAGAVVTKSFLEGDCVIAGVPGRVVKEIASYKGKRSVEI
jgi:serine acetyltransferase